MFKIINIYHRRSPTLLFNVFFYIKKAWYLKERLFLKNCCGKEFFWRCLLKDGNGWGGGRGNFRKNPFGDKHYANFILAFRAWSIWVTYFVICPDPRWNCTLEVYWAIGSSSLCYQIERMRFQGTIHHYKTWQFCLLTYENISVFIQIVCQIFRSQNKYTIYKSYFTWS